MPVALEKICFQWCAAIALIMIVSGAILIGRASGLPVYTDPNAPSRLSLELQNLERDARFEQWYKQLATFETKHKSLVDAGRGWIAAGSGLLLAGLLLTSYERKRWLRSKPFLFGCWIALWAIRIPLTFWYYTVRQERFDFPIWGDSVAIPIFSESFAWVVLALVSSIVLGILFIRHPLPDRLGFHRPQSTWGWVRTCVISLWLVLNAFGLFGSIPDGDEGMTFSCIVSGALLLILLLSKEIKPEKESCEIASQPAKVIGESPPHSVELE